MSRKFTISQSTALRTALVTTFLVLSLSLAKMNGVLSLNYPGEEDELAVKIGRALFEAYDPLTTRPQLDKRIKHQCIVDVLSPDELQNHPKRQQWGLSRFVAYHNINQYLQKRWQNRSSTQPRLKVLDASGSVFLKQFQDHLDISTTDYSKVDLHRTPFEDNSFDLVSADQVLEHTYMPHIIMLEIHRILKPGGLAVLTTVSFNPLHEAGGFHDLWRFMVDGMLQLSMPFKGGVKVCGGWGNARTISTRTTHGMGTSEEIRIFREEHDELLSRNEPSNPFIVWLVAEK